MVSETHEESNCGLGFEFGQYSVLKCVVDLLKKWASQRERKKQKNITIKDPSTLHTNIGVGCWMVDVQLRDG